MLLKLVGVDDETICWEYALTEPGLGEWRAQFIERIAQTGLGGGGGRAKQQVYTSDKPGISREEAARICGSRAGNMRAWLRAVLEGEFGGVQRYLTKMCGLSNDEVRRLRDSLIREVKPEDVVRPSEIPGWTPDGGVVDG